MRLETGNRTIESRAWPKNVEVVNWREDDRKVNFKDYPSLKVEFEKAVLQVKPDLIHAGPIQRVAYLPALMGFHPLLTMSWGFDLMEDAKRDNTWEDITRFVLSRSDWFTSDCQATKNVAIELGMEASRTTVFPWGVDLELFNPSRRGMMRRQVGYEADLLIVHTRSWEPRYGVDIALQGFGKAIEREPNLRMFILGGGSQEAMVKEFVKKNGLEERIHFCGYKRNEALAGYYQAADIFLSASHIDGSSVALLESMACACPALVSDIPANLEWITDGSEGWVYRNGDADHLALRIVEIARDRRNILEKGRIARMKVEEFADWSKSKHILLDTYYQVINQHSLER